MLNGWQVEFTGMGEPWKNKQFGNAKYHKQTSNLNSANSKRVAEDNFIETKAFFPFSTKEQTRLWHRGHWDSNIFNSFIRDVNFKILRCLVLKLYYSNSGVHTTRLAVWQQHAIALWQLKDKKELGNRRKEK